MVRIGRDFGLRGNSQLLVAPEMPSLRAIDGNVEVWSDHRLITDSIHKTEIPLEYQRVSKTHFEVCPCPSKFLICVIRGFVAFL